MVKSRRFRRRVLAVCGWALLYIIIIIYCPICFTLPILPSPTTTISKSSTSSSVTNSSSLTAIQQIISEYSTIMHPNNLCSTINMNSTSNLNNNLINNNNTNSEKCNYTDHNHFSKPYLNLQNDQNSDYLKTTTNNNNETHFDHATVNHTKKLNSIYIKKRKRKKLSNTTKNSNILIYLSNNCSSVNNSCGNNNSNNNINNNNNNNNSNNNSNYNNFNTINIYNNNKPIFHINSETLKPLRTYSNNSEIKNSDQNQLKSNVAIKKSFSALSTTIEPSLNDFETTTFLQILLSRTDRSIHQDEKLKKFTNSSGGGGDSGSENKKRNRLKNSNLDRNERSANLSHITGGSARKIQLYIKNRFIQLMPDGTINGTQDDMSDYTILQRTTVDIGQIKIQGVATCLYLCMDQCGSVYGSKSFSDDCVFNESMEQHHYNTYSSTYNSNSRRTLYLALNRHGEPRKLQIPPSRSLGKLATYTKSLTSTVPDERVEKLIAHTFGENRIKHGLRQLCDGGKPLIELTTKIMKKRVKCNQNNGSIGGTDTITTVTSQTTTTISVTTPSVSTISTTLKTILNSENISLSRTTTNFNVNKSRHSSNNNTRNSNNSNTNIHLKKKKKKRRCRPDELDENNCHRVGTQASKKKHLSQHQQKIKCNNQSQNNATTQMDECRNVKKNLNAKRNHHHHHHQQQQQQQQQQNGTKVNVGLKRNRRLQNGTNPNNIGQNRIIMNRARNGAVSRSASTRHLRHHHTTSTTASSLTIQILQDNVIATTELSNQQDTNDDDDDDDVDDDLSQEDSSHSINSHNDGNDEITTKKSLLAQHNHRAAQFISDDASTYDDDFDV